MIQAWPHRFAALPSRGVAAFETRNDWKSGRSYMLDYNMADRIEGAHVHMSQVPPEVPTGASHRDPKDDQEKVGGLEVAGRRGLEGGGEGGDERAGDTAHRIDERHKIAMGHFGGGAAARSEPAQAAEAAQATFVVTHGAHAKTPRRCWPRRHCDSLRVPRPRRREPGREDSAQGRAKSAAHARSGCLCPEGCVE